MCLSAGSKIPKFCFKLANPLIVKHSIFPPRPRDQRDHVLLIGGEEYLVHEFEFNSTHVDLFCAGGSVPNLEVPSADCGQKFSVGAESYAGGNNLVPPGKPHGKAEELLSGLDTANVNVRADCRVRVGYCQEKPIRAERNAAN